MNIDKNRDHAKFGYYDIEICFIHISIHMAWMFLKWSEIGWPMAWMGLDAAKKLPFYYKVYFPDVSLYKCRLDVLNIVFLSDAFSSIFPTLW